MNQINKINKEFIKFRKLNRMTTQIYKINENEIK